MEPDASEAKPKANARTRFVRMAIFGVCGMIGLGAVAMVAGSLGEGSVGPTVEPLPPPRTTRTPTRRPKVRLHPTVTDPSFEPATPHPSGSPSAASSTDPPSHEK